MLVGLVAAVPAFLAGRWLAARVWRIVAFIGALIAGLSAGVAIAFLVPALADVGPVGPYVLGVLRVAIGASLVGALFSIWRR